MEAAWAGLPPVINTANKLIRLTVDSHSIPCLSPFPSLVTLLKIINDQWLVWLPTLNQSRAVSGMIGHKNVSWLVDYKPAAGDIEFNSSRVTYFHQWWPSHSVCHYSYHWIYKSSPEPNLSLPYHCGNHIAKLMFVFNSKKAMPPKNNKDEFATFVFS